MSKKEFICIGCPMGCNLVVEMDEKTGEVLSVTGNSCRTGEIYAHKEATNPRRIVTSSVPVDGGDMAMVSVKTKSDVPKKMIFPVMDAIHKVRMHAPVRIGDVVIHDVLGTGIDVVATRNIHAGKS
ncbi:MAG: DUF1667 domain-containing protein [Sphaerochaeta sp.]|jgi:CxxC motif-containing protein|nr:DUF1667 domain-containing protein [Sphaerochaeta sp.]MCI2046023.1 DUF1667 domain-containing protein [Sphaerochaeta sp.]MCI2076995.1 DUF1667 domain-containing protein [Sphaerochaeta sp.]MCI2097423.1 DUF1667 domain-containing protein [Sphaerochaeta sp.]